MGFVPRCSLNLKLKFMYTIFTRNWYKKDANGKIVPNPGARRTRIDFADTEQQAREICSKWNESHKLGVLSRKAEYTKNSNY